MAVNADNVLAFGSDNDSLYLGEYDKSIATKIKGLTTAIPQGFEDCGWLGEDGVALTMDDSVTKIKGHQGHGVVRTFMDSSETALTASLLESRLSTVQRYLNATAEKIQETVKSEQVNIAKITAKAQRKVTVLSGILDVFDTASSANAVHMRIVLPRLELGERGEITFKVGDLTAYAHTLNITDDYIIYTNHAPLIPA
ncbi:hypothetical protein NSA19_00955 [Actinomyces bowdenii]|uniref:hypothetical protein n=1 Tax=Actinomyces bowdenii TaxID=131109 RepID=UPI00214AC473|nr:hypothetical protein [Actinomyces bowdenii]MCR2051445.1 hypothetical protein [Actinomyces bowdenii]